MRAQTVVAVAMVFGLALAPTACSSSEDSSEPTPTGSGEGSSQRVPVEKDFVGRTVESVQVSDGVAVDARDVAADLGVGPGGQPPRSVGGDLSDWNIVAACPDIVDGRLVAGVVTGEEWEQLLDRDGVTETLNNPPTHLLRCP